MIFFARELVNEFNETTIFVYSTLSFKLIAIVSSTRQHFFCEFGVSEREKE